MHSVMRVTVAATVLGIASLSLAASAHAGNGSAVGAGLSDLVSAPLWATHSHRKRYMSLRLRRSITRHLLLYMSRPRRFMWARSTTSGIPIETIAAKSASWMGVSHTNLRQITYCWGL